MYTKEEKSKLVKEFWTVFGKYLAPIYSAEGEKISWINYKSNFKSVKIFTDVNTKYAEIGFKILHSDPNIRFEIFNDLFNLKEQLGTEIDGLLNWEINYEDENFVQFSKISIVLEGINVLNKQDWPTIIQFLKPKLIAIDSFWCNWKYGFQEKFSA